MTPALPTVAIELRVWELDATEDPPRVVFAADSVEALRPLAQFLGEKVRIVVTPAQEPDRDGG